MASHPDPTQPVRLFLQYTDIVLSLIGTCLAVVVLNATMHSFPGVVHFGPILLLHILLRGFGWTQMATFTSFSAVLILQIYHVYNVHPANAVIQSNATPWEKVWLSFGWFAIGFHIGLQPVRLRTRVAMAAVSNALRILRLLRIFWLTREQGVLLMVVTNSFLCLVGFMSALMGRRLSASCASLLELAGSSQHTPVEGPPVEGPPVEGLPVEGPPVEGPSAGPPAGPPAGPAGAAPAAAEGRLKLEPSAQRPLAPGDVPLADQRAHDALGRALTLEGTTHSLSHSHSHSFTLSHPSSGSSCPSYPSSDMHAEGMHAEMAPSPSSPLTSSGGRLAHFDEADEPTTGSATAVAAASSAASLDALIRQSAERARSSSILTSDISLARASTLASARAADDASPLSRLSPPLAGRTPPAPSSAASASAALPIAQCLLPPRWPPPLPRLLVDAPASLANEGANEGRSPPPQIHVPARATAAAAAAGGASPLASPLAIAVGAPPLAAASSLVAEVRLLTETFAPSQLDAALANACIPQGQLALHSFLGKGAFGDVYEGSWAQPEAQAKAQPTPAAAASSQGADGHAQGVEAAASQHEVTRTTPTTVVTRRVAVKLIHRHRIEAEQLSVFKRAASLELQLAAHPNIVRLFGWSMVPETAQLMLAMEFCGGRSLGDSIDSGATRKWGERRTLTVALDVARGIAFLHAQDPPVLHRDLKPANIIFDEARGAKLADFGASRVAAVDGNWMTSWGVGTPLFAAPEQLTYQIYDRSVDLWAYGCVLACLANHEGTPFGPRLQVTDRMLARVASGSLVPEAAADHVLHTLVRDCCQPSTLRPAAAHVVERLTLQLDELPTIVADIGGGCVSGSPTSEPAAC